MKRILACLLGSMIFSTLAATVELAPGASVTIVCKTAGSIPPPEPPPPPPPPPSGCTPQGHLPRTLTFGFVDQLRMGSGVVASYPLIPANTPKSSIMMTQGQTPVTPPGVLTEMTISRCPGVISSVVPQCYKSGTFVNNFNITAYVKPTAYGWNSQATLGNRGCWAPASEGQWYLNVRWTYSSCPFGSCGFSMQWANGPY